MRQKMEGVNLVKIHYKQICKCHNASSFVQLSYANFKKDKIRKIIGRKMKQASNDDINIHSWIMPWENHQVPFNYIF
jgi:hypothetical protein